MLQALQWQRKEEEESGSRGGEASHEESRKGIGSCDGAETLQVSFPIATKDCPYASCLPTSPFFSNTAGYPRLSWPEISRGRRRGSEGHAETREGSEGHSGAPDTSITESACLRPAVGPRALAAPSWPSATAKVSPQLLGGRSETDAHILISDFNDIAYFGADASFDKRISITPGQSRPLLSPHWATRSEADASPSRTATKTPSPPKTPASAHSSSSPQTPSTSSQKSYASSFAYLLRNNRADKRLLKKSSKPSQHLHKHSASVKPPPMVQHSASYYNPKVVEDTAALMPPTRNPVNANSSLGLKPPVSNTPTRPPIRRARSSPSQSESALSPAISTSPLTIKLPPVPRYGPDRDAPEVSTQSYHGPMGTSSGSASHSGDSVRKRQFASANLPRTDFQSKPIIYTQRNFALNTPPESEPRTPYDSTERHGDHYFRTFGTDTIYQKTPSPLTSAERDAPHPPPPSKTMVLRPPARRLQSDQVVPSGRLHKQSSIFGSIFRSPDVTENSIGTHRGEVPETSPPPKRVTPDITVSTPQIAKGKHMSPADSYFPHPRRAKESSEATPSPAPSGLSTNWEDVVAESQPVGHVNEPSEPMSPFSLPPPPRPKLNRVQEHETLKKVTRRLPHESIVAVVPSGAVAGPQLKYKAGDGREYFKTSLTGANALSFLPSEMERVNTPPLNKKPSGFRGFFFDMRSIPAEQAGTEPESPEARATIRRAPLIPKTSLQALLPKLSKPKLKRKLSMQTKEEPRPPPNPLEVTGFQQTPYSQRYGDARRAKMSQIRVYVEETLKEDDDEIITSSFELEVPPDHLPNSPLCPLSPRHDSGGRGICPIHSRKRRAPAAAKSQKGRPKKPSPKIVFGSGPQGDGKGSDGSDDFMRRMLR